MVTKTGPKLDEKEEVTVNQDVEGTKEEGATEVKVLRSEDSKLVVTKTGPKLDEGRSKG